MRILSARIQRGLESLTQGDVESASARLTEVARKPGALEPITGLDAETEAQFYLLQGRLAEIAEDAHTAQEAYVKMTHAQWDAGLITEEDLDFDDEHEEDEDTHGCGCHAIAVTACACDDVPTYHQHSLDPKLEVTHYTGLDTGGEVLVLEGEQHQTQTLETKEERRETEITTRVRRVSILTEEGLSNAAPEEAWEEATGQPWVGESDPNLISCHVEEIRMLRTTRVYRQGAGEEETSDSA